MSGSAPVSVYCAMFPQRCNASKGSGATVKKSTVRLKDALGSLRETQKDSQKSKIHALRFGSAKEALLPGAPIAVTKRQLGGHSALSSPKKTADSDLASSLSEMSIYRSVCRGAVEPPHSAYTVTRYMLTRPMSLRSVYGGRKRKEDRDAKTFVNPQIERFLNRFEKAREKVAAPGIVLNPHSD